MNSDQIRLSKTQLDDFAAVSALGAEKLKQVEGALKREPTTIKHQVIRATIKSTIGEEIAPSLYNVLLGLAALRRRDRRPAAEIVADVDSGLVFARWEAEKLAAWRQVAPVVTRILESGSVATAAKALDLSYDFVRVLTDLRVLTDIRPVFNDDRSAIVGSAVAGTLRLDYFEQGVGHTSFSIRLDLEDLENMKKVAEEAIKKARLSKELMESRGTETIILGSDE